MVVVVYCDMADDEAAKLIADTFGYELAYIPTAEADPLIQHIDVDIISVGGGYPNPFSKHYFPSERVWDSILNPTNFPDNPELWRMSQSRSFGVSPDGKRLTWTIIRENGTRVTGVWGVHKEDTLEAARRYCLPVVPVVGVVLPLAGIIPAETVWVLRGKK